MSKITYSNKVTFNPQPSVADINKVTADDMNEIKSVVNTNDDNVTANATAITNLSTYSTTEVDTGKTWIDGKKIYRIVINDTLGTTNGSWKQINVFSANYVDQVVSLEGTFSVSNGSFYNIPFSRVTDSSYSNKEYCLCNFTPSAGVYSIVTGSNNFSAYSGRPFTAIMEYTKA